MGQEKVIWTRRELNFVNLKLKGWSTSEKCFKVEKALNDDEEVV